MFNIDKLFSWHEKWSSGGGSARVMVRAVA